MSIERGDVYLARFPHASGTRGKRRPVVIVQADVYNQRLRVTLWSSSSLRIYQTKTIQRA
jgi:mRNA-degrading endonuclease toxin of MazEF toxin-antitoxin module